MEAAILVALTVFILLHLSPTDLLRDTTTVGGDTPAHNYLASHLQAQLFGHGRIISWAGGWWCGFPMFQFYFCLPYLLVALLSVIMPFNIAFKLVSILGVLALPGCAHGAARLMRLPRPVPVILAILMVPFLFVRMHAMWGVNLHSTLAGMIANSISFPLMLLAVASAFRDVEDRLFRLRTAFLLALVMASHFFTSVMAVLVLAAMPLVAGRTRFRSTIGILAATGGLAALLMAWWLVPLVAKSDYSMDFGTNWQMALWKTFPSYTAGLIPFAVLAPVLAVRRGIRAVWLFLWMFAAGLGLFLFGFGLSPVFVNVRLWPFVFFAVVALGAVGLGLSLQRAYARAAIVTTLFAGVLAAVETGEGRAGPGSLGPVRSWAEWNYSGLESKPAWPAFRDLVMPLKGTPGRLANDLSPDNNALGSSRIFELVPHLTGKPILEGGLVNSAVGSLFSYYVQSETSQNCAGYPPMLVPTAFNIANATRHLRLLNVKHFMARWPGTQQALRTSPDWRLLREAGGWELYELTNHDGHYVTIPGLAPAVVETRRWTTCPLAWLYTIEAVDQLFILSTPGEPAPAGAARLTEDQFRRVLVDRRGSRPDPRVTAPGGSAAGAAVFSPVRIDAAGRRITNEIVEDDLISFDTDAIGVPHLVKCTWSANWKVSGADRIYRVTPAFMLVYPRQTHVELRYGSTPSDIAGRLLTVLGWALVGLVWWRRRQVGRRSDLPTQPPSSR